MNTFIDRVINEVQQISSDELRKCCIIFPTRRACLIFRKRFAAQLQLPVYSPGITAIGDFVSKHVSYPVSEEIPLLLTLFDIYKKHWPDQDFGKFYSWGQMLLNDFDEIDKQLRDPARIFSHISELKKIDAAFLLDEESIKWINEFIASLNHENPTELQKRFSNTWNRLLEIYNEFNTALVNKGMTYEGKAYNEIIKKLKSGTFTSQWSRFIFAGFYGLSRVEEDMLRILSSKFPVSVLWDSDPYYIQNKHHEAGYYFRKSSLTSQEAANTNSIFDSGKKSITISGIPLQVGQAKYAGELLAALAADDQQLNSTAVILPDENMLFPILYSLPESIKTINVTMGYPLKQSQYPELIKVLHQLHANSKTEKSGIVFHHRDVKRIFNHPLLKRYAKNNKENEFSSFSRFVNVTDITEQYDFSDAGEIFQAVTTSDEVLPYLHGVLSYLKNEISSRSGHAVHFEDKIIDYIAGELLILSEHLSGNLYQINSETIWQMADECISGIKIPFSGEPVQGLQIMGFLETRALDFKNIIVLNVNEGTLPLTSANKSFIPFSLRKAYGLSTYEEQDASFSYHFYRLLQHSDTIHLLYNSEVSKTNGGEPSRFLLQIKQELKKYMGDRLSIIENFVSTPILPETVQPIIIRKGDEVMKVLKEYLADAEHNFKRKFSSSALITYMGCSLKFYYRYVANLKEEEEDVTAMEANIFGNILHKTLEVLYGKITGPVSKNEIEKLITEVDDVVDAAVHQEYKIPVHQLEGNDILLADVIKELAKRILQADKAEIPFTIKGREEKIAAEFKTGSSNVMLYGSIDRIDEKNNVTRIIDYKTGQVELKYKSIEDLFTNPKKKTLFQLYFYGLLYSMNHPGESIKTGFYVARNLGSGISWPNNGEILNTSDLETFTGLLEKKIMEILNPEINFVQTTDLKQCEFCEYKIICNR